MSFSFASTFVSNFQGVVIGSNIWGTANLTKKIYLFKILI